MKIVHEMRERGSFEAPKSTSPIPIVLGAILAFGIGVLGMTGLVKTPSILFKPKTMAVAVEASAEGRTAEVAIDGANRIGRAETAPLLKMCVPMQRLGFSREQRVEPGDLYRLLQSAAAMSRVAAIAGIPQKAVDGVEFAAIWAEIADCVYRQNGWMLCDPDNRAFAVEAASTFVRQLATATRSEKTPDARAARAPRGVDRNYLLQNAQAAKARVLAGLRQHAADGRLIAADFGLFAASELLQTLRGTKAQRNACAG